MLRKTSTVIAFWLALMGVAPALADQTTLPLPTPPQTAGSIVKFQDKHARAQFLVDNDLKLGDLHYKAELGAYEAPKTPGQIVGDSGTKVEPNMVYHVMQTPNDPLYSQQYYFNTLNAPATWDVTTGSSSVIIADIDTGFAMNQQDLKNKWWTNSGEMGATASEGPTPNCTSQSLPLDKSCNNLDNDGDGYASDWRGWDFVDNTNDPSAGKTSPTSSFVGHGTATASLLAAETNDSVGLAGMCWACKIMPLQALGDNGQGVTSDIATAIHYAVDHGATVINMSFGSPTNDPTLQSAISYAESKNVVLVAAAGNGGPGDVEYPAAYSGVIAVGATDQNNQFASFNSTGTPISVVAPGVNVLCDTWTQANQTTATELADGTSLASPLIAGLVGLLQSSKPTASPSAILTALQNSTTQVPSGNTNYILPNSFSALTVIDGLSTIYRLYSPRYGDHFYTASANEADYAAAHYGYIFEGERFDMTLNGDATTTPVYRLYSPGKGVHFYTISTSERDFAVAHYGYVYEGAFFNAPINSSSSTTPVYRLYNPFTNDHFFTTSAAERDYATAHYNYSFEGNGFTSDLAP